MYKDGDKLISNLKLQSSHQYKISMEHLTMMVIDGLQIKTPDWVFWADTYNPPRFILYKS